MQTAPANHSSYCSSLHLCVGEQKCVGQGIEGERGHTCEVRGAADSGPRSAVRQGPSCEACTATLCACSAVQEGEQGCQPVCNTHWSCMLTDRAVLVVIAAYLFFIACKGAVSIALVGLLVGLLGSVPSLLLAQLLNQILHTRFECEL